jgi:hypothetical protein
VLTVMTAAAPRLRVTLYTRPGCHLCDDLKRDLYTLQDGLRFDVDERNIDEDGQDFARYRFLIPVLDIPGGPLLTPPHDLFTLRAALERALAEAHGDQSA